MGETGVGTQDGPTEGALPPQTPREPTAQANRSLFPLYSFRTPLCAGFARHHQPAPLESAKRIVAVSAGDEDPMTDVVKYMVKYVESSGDCKR